MPKLTVPVHTISLDAYVMRVEAICPATQQYDETYCGDDGEALVIEQRYRLAGWPIVLIRREPVLLEAQQMMAMEIPR